MAAIAWDRFDDRGSIRRAPLGLVPAPPYRRRRLVALVAAVAVLALLTLGAQALLRSARGTATAGAVPVAPSVVVADAGDSYWSLAGQLDRGGDLRSTVDALVDANGGRDLRPGDRIVLPS